MKKIAISRLPLMGSAAIAACFLSSSTTSLGHPADDNEAVNAPYERPDLPFPPGIDPVSVCGPTDELQDVELYDGSLGVTRQFVKDREPSVVQLRWIDEAEMRRRYPDHILGNVASERWCTGTLIGPTTVLTAGHCFDVGRGQAQWYTPFKRNADGSASYLPPAELAKLQTVIFNYQVSSQNRLPRPGQPFPIKQLVEYRLGGLDFAIVELERNGTNQLPSALGYQPARVSARTVRPPKGELLAIIQHPQGDPKKIEAGALDAFAGSNIFYGDIDTHGGSSGSAILDPNGEILGVHTNGGCHTAGGLNKGFDIQAIRAASNVIP